MVLVIILPLVRARYRAAIGRWCEGCLVFCSTVGVHRAVYSAVELRRGVGLNGVLRMLSNHISALVSYTCLRDAVSTDQIAGRRYTFLPSKLLEPLVKG